MYASSVVNRKRRKPRKTMIPTTAASTTERRRGRLTPPVRLSDRAARRPPVQLVWSLACLFRSTVEEALAAKRREGPVARQARRREDAHESRAEIGSRYVRSHREEIVQEQHQSSGRRLEETETQVNRDEQHRSREPAHEARPGVAAETRGPGQDGPEED